LLNEEIKAEKCFALQRIWTHTAVGTDSSNASCTPCTARTSEHPTWATHGATGLMGMVASARHGT